jgi:hypothetical protein
MSWPGPCGVGEPGDIAGSSGHLGGELKNSRIEFFPWAFVQDELPGSLAHLFSHAGVILKTLHGLHQRLPIIRRDDEAGFPVRPDQ